MNSIPIFDSLTHPTINGFWNFSKNNLDSNLDQLIMKMEASNIFGGFAVGMHSIGGYDERNYAKFIHSRTKKLLPIAFFNVNETRSVSSIRQKMRELKMLNYTGIKLHPRLGRFSLLSSVLPTIIKVANDEGLTVLFCTYFYECSENIMFNNVDNLLKMLVKVPNEKLILLHSGAVRLLEVMEIARSFRNVLLDLSFTLNKYSGSSLDMDIDYLFNNFDQRICIGSDHPQFSMKELRSRFEYFSKNLDINKAENIAYKNIRQFIKIK